jgi:hypothetical protein
MNAHPIRLAAVLLALAAPTVAGAQEVANRERLQQERIGQGLESGQITARGAAHLEHREARIDASRRADLAAHDGHLTPGETRRLNNRENSVSRNIYADKHNDVAQPGVVPR